MDRISSFGDFFAEPHGSDHKMYIPITDLSSRSAKLDLAAVIRVLDNSKDDSPTGWHSIIGIVTAICGNIIISFALNTQRYAHIRLSREKDAQQEKQKNGKARVGNKDTYGTAQESAAAVRLRKSLNGHPNGKKDNANDEAAPLLDGRDSRDEGQNTCLLYTSPSPRDRTRSRMPSSA